MKNSIKRGRLFWLFKSKTISFEWNLKIDPLNFYLHIDGDEGRYIFCFWFIFVFYISFSGIFKWFPKEWNSYTNGYLNTGSVKYGISQYDDHISFYLHHDGENSWHPDKDKKILYFNFFLKNIFFGYGRYNHTDLDKYVTTINLVEGIREIEVVKYLQEFLYERPYMKIFNKKTKRIRITSNIEVPSSNYNVYNVNHEEVLSLDEFYNKSDDYYIEEYSYNILKRRYIFSREWIPKAYVKSYNRNLKIDNILKD